MKDHGQVLRAHQLLADLAERVVLQLNGAVGVARHAQLSDRELEVLRLVAKGLANKQIGRRLGITERTVKSHLGQVFRQLGVPDRTSAALWARDHLPPQ